MANEVEQAITELDTLFALYVPRRDGLKMLLRLELQPHTAEEVQTSLSHYERRIGLIVAASIALHALMNDGHPNIPIRDIDPSVLKELTDDAAEIENALAQFDSNAASVVGLKAGAATPKV